METNITTWGWYENYIRALAAKLKKLFRQWFLQITLPMLINDVMAKVDSWSLVLLKFAKSKILGVGGGGILETMNIENVFHFLDHGFLVTALNKFGFGSNFLSWIKLLLNSQ